MDKVFNFFSSTNFWISFLLSFLTLLGIAVTYFKIIKNRITKKTFLASVKISESYYKTDSNFYHTAFNFNFQNKTNRQFYLYSIVPIILGKYQPFYVDIESPFSPILVEPYQIFSTKGFIKSNWNANLPNTFSISLQVHNKTFYMQVKDYEPNKLIVLFEKKIKNKNCSVNQKKYKK